MELVTTSTAALMVGAETSVTLVLAAAAVTGDVSFESMVQPEAVTMLPEVAVGDTCTTSCTEPPAPALSVPRSQLTWLPDSVAPPVVDTKVVFAGIDAVTTTPSAGELPVLA